MPEILLPFVVSTSGFNSPAVDWAYPFDPPVMAVACRASLGTPEWMGGVKRATDQSFPFYWPQFDRLRMIRIAYSFMYNGAGGADQARWFVNCVNAAGGFHPCDGIMLDAEIATGLSIKEIVDWLYQAHVLVPFVPLKNFLFYSRDDLTGPLNFSKLTAAEKAFIKSIRTYPAGYPRDITGWTFDRLIAAYGFDQTRYGPAVLQQYAASYTIPGISMPGSESVEMNVIDTAYLAERQKDVADYYGAAPVTPDTISTPWPGVKVTTGRRFDASIQVVDVDWKAIQVATVEFPGGGHFVEDIGGDIVANGGDFDMTNYLPIGLLTSHERQVSHQADFEPALGFYDDGLAGIDHQFQGWPNAVGLKRYLVKDGMVSPTTSDAWNAREPRTIYGAKKDGSLVILQCKGRASDQAGIDLYQAARTMIEFGAWEAGDGDSGDSVQSKVAGEVFQGTTQRRLVADFVAIMINSRGVSMDKYKCTVTWDGGASVRPEPTTANSGSHVYADGEIFYASELVADRDNPSDVTKQWAVISSDPTHGTQFAGKYVAVKYPASSGAVDRCTVEEIGAPPPAGATIEHIEVVYTDGSRQNFIPQ